MPVSGSSALCFGKLPSHADFIRFNAASREVLAFDEWLHHGLYFARTQMGQTWEQAFARSPQYHFLFYPENAERFLAGVMQASQDKSQRKYPFLVSMLMDRRLFPDSQVYLAPIVFSEFFERARQIVDRALGGLEMREISDQTQALNVPVLDHGTTESRYREEYLDALSVREFWQRLFGSFEDPRKYLLFKNLTEVLLPLRHRSLSRMNLGLRFPLSKGGDTTAFEVCFWLHVSMALLDASPGTPFLFWNLPHSDAAGYLFLFFRQPSARNFLQLIRPEAENDTICAMDEEGKEKLATVAQTLSYSHRALLEAGDEKLSHFLHGLKKAV